MISEVIFENVWVEESDSQGRGANPGKWVTQKKRLFFPRKLKHFIHPELLPIFENLDEAAIQLSMMEALSPKLKEASANSQYYVTAILPYDHNKVRVLYAEYLHGEYIAREILCPKSQFHSCEVAVRDNLKRGVEERIVGTGHTPFGTWYEGIKLRSGMPELTQGNRPVFKSTRLQVPFSSQGLGAVLVTSIPANDRVEFIQHTARQYPENQTLISMLGQVKSDRYRAHAATALKSLSFSQPQERSFYGQLKVQDHLFGKRSDDQKLLGDAKFNYALSLLSKADQVCVKDLASHRYRMMLADQILQKPVGTPIELQEILKSLDIKKHYFGKEKRDENRLRALLRSSSPRVVFTPVARVPSKSPGTANTSSTDMTDAEASVIIDASPHSILKASSDLLNSSLEESFSSLESSAVEEPEFVVIRKKVSETPEQKLIKKLKPVSVASDVSGLAQYERNALAYLKSSDFHELHKKSEDRADRKLLFTFLRDIRDSTTGHDRAMHLLQASGNVRLLSMFPNLQKLSENYCHDCLKSFDPLFDACDQGIISQHSAAPLFGMLSAIIHSWVSQPHFLAGKVAEVQLVLNFQKSIQELLAAFFPVPNAEKRLVLARELELACVEFLERERAVLGSSCSGLYAYLENQKNKIVEQLEERAASLKLLSNEVGKRTAIGKVLRAVRKDVRECQSKSDFYQRAHILLALLNPAALSNFEVCFGQVIRSDYRNLFPRVAKALEQQWAECVLPAHKACSLLWAEPLLADLHTRLSSLLTRQDSNQLLVLQKALNFYNRLQGLLSTGMLSDQSAHDIRQLIEANCGSDVDELLQGRITQFRKVLDLQPLYHQLTQCEAILNPNSGWLASVVEALKLDLRAHQGVQDPMRLAAICEQAQKLCRLLNDQQLIELQGELFANFPEAKRSFEQRPLLLQPNTAVASEVRNQWPEASFYPFVRAAWLAQLAQQDVPVDSEQKRLFLMNMAAIPVEAGSFSEQMMARWKAVFEDATPEIGARAHLYFPKIAKAYLHDSLEMMKADTQNSGLKGNIDQLNAMLQEYCAAHAHQGYAPLFRLLTGLSKVVAFARFQCDNAQWDGRALLGFVEQFLRLNPQNQLLVADEFLKQAQELHDHTGAKEHNQEAFQQFVHQLTGVKNFLPVMPILTQSSSASSGMFRQ